MPSTSRAVSALAATACLFLTMASYGDAATQQYLGCYSSSQPLKSQGTWTYQSTGYCQTKCLNISEPVFGLSDGDVCWCGSEIPATSGKTSNSNCDTPCQGWPSVNCTYCLHSQICNAHADTCTGGGGTAYFSIYLTGEQTNPPTYDGGDSSSSSSPSSSDTTSSGTSTQTPTVVTSTGPGKTVIITKPASASTSSAAPTKQSSGSSNVAGIAAGVVVGVVAVVSIIGGLFFYLRHRRRKAAEEEYARTNQVSDFMRGGERKPPPTGYSNMSDSRLDPESNKRNSVGSLADNQDYSRRILRVSSLPPPPTSL